MFRGGRPRDPIWDHFNLVEEGSKKAAKCKMCFYVQSMKVCRMKTHFQKCAQKVHYINKFLFLPWQQAIILTSDM